MIMKFEVWIFFFFFFENWRFKFKILALRMWNWKLGNENFWIENLDFERYLKTLKNIFFFFFFFLGVDSALAEFKCVGLKFWPPHFLVSLFSFLLHLLSTFYSPIGTIHLLLPLDFSSLFHHFFLQKTFF